MAAKFKQKCIRCRKNYVLISWKQKFPVCYDCQKKELEGEIKDPKMKKLFKISEELYKQNLFLRSIKINYLRYGKLSEKQLEAFKKAVKDIKERNKKEKESSKEE
tara:strand:+ start:85 stop:399 length:315 start_codon:yes stop_codon:yes gene_type:complete